LRRSGTRVRKRNTFGDDYEADEQFKEKPNNTPTTPDPELSAPSRKRQKTESSGKKEKDSPEEEIISPSAIARPLASSPTAPASTSSSSSKSKNSDSSAL